MKSLEVRKEICILLKGKTKLGELHFIIRYMCAHDTLRYFVSSDEECSVRRVYPKNILFSNNYSFVLLCY
jgi:hypothetical protein